MTLLILLSLMGCANMKGTECSWVKIITVSKDDKFTAETAREILAHNEKVEALCK